MTLKAAILGPTSYTGRELIKLLLRHPHAELTYLASHRDELPVISDEFPELLGRCDMPCQPADAKAMADAADVAFVCLPHVAAMSYVPALLDAGLRVIDLSADYRLADASLYEQVYEHTHADPGNLAHAVYGLPELFPDAIPDAKLVANPGCYPTAAALAIAPLLKAGLVAPLPIIINAASGISGAGRKPKPNLHFPEANEGFNAYSPGIHRHQPEIRQTLDRFARCSSKPLFVPHLLPINQGIHETIYLTPTSNHITQEVALQCLREFYAHKPFVRVKGDLPNVRHVAGTNYCDLSVRLAEGQLIAFAAEDNLIKGASGQAVQNMNLMFGFEESAGL